MRAARLPGVLIVAGRRDGVQPRRPDDRSVSATRPRRRSRRPRRRPSATWPTSVRWIATSARTSLASVRAAAWQLVAGIPDPTEYHLDLDRDAEAGASRGERVRLTFEVFDPWKDRPVEKFTVVHEKLFHAFIVSRDLQFFVHDHPTWENGAFHYDIAFPKPGMYRVLGDFYPGGGDAAADHRHDLRRRRRGAGRAAGARLLGQARPRT